MAAPEKPWKAEYAKSGRASCRTCKNNIAKEVLRLGKMVQSQQFDGFMPMWHHATCILKKAKQIKFVDDVEGIESLRWEDQQKLRKYIDEKGGSNDSSAVHSYLDTSFRRRVACRLDTVVDTTRDTSGTRVWWSRHRHYTDTYGVACLKCHRNENLPWVEDDREKTAVEDRRNPKLLGFEECGCGVAFLHFLLFSFYPT